MSAHYPDYQDASFIRARAPRSSGDFLRSIPDVDPYAEADDAGSEQAAAPAQVPVARRVPAAPRAPRPAPSSRRAPRSPGVLTRQRPGLLSRIGSGIKSAWAGLKSLFGGGRRSAESGMSAPKDPGFWNAPHPALAGNEAERDDPFVSRSLMRFPGRADPYAGMADLDEAGRPDTPSPRSAPVFDGNFRMPPGVDATPGRPADGRGVASEGSESAGSWDDHDRDVDGMYDAIPRSGSFVGQESPAASAVGADRPSAWQAAAQVPRAAAPVRTGYEKKGMAMHYLDVMSAENQRRLWAEADAD